MGAAPVNRLCARVLANEKRPAATGYAAFRDRLSTRPSAVSLLQPLQPALATDYVLVVPQDVSSFRQPTLEILPVDLIGRSVADFGGFEAAFLFQSFLLKRLTTPKEKTDAFFQLAVPDNGTGKCSHRRGAVYPRDMPLNRGSLGAHRDLVSYE